MSDDKNEIVIIPNRRATEEDNRRGRAVSARLILWELLRALKNRTDPLNWLTKGGHDAEEFLECLDKGLPHPLLDDWQERKSASSRPAPTSREKGIRRLAVLACLALDGTMKDIEARKLVANEIGKAKVFADAPNEETLRRWRRESSPLTPQDHAVIESAKKKAGTERQKLVSYFVGLMDIARKAAPLLKVR